MFSKTTVSFTHVVLNGELARFPVRAAREFLTDLTPVASFTNELNRHFDDPDEPPFRPFLLQRKDDFYFWNRVPALGGGQRIDSSRAAATGSRGCLTGRLFEIEGWRLPREGYWKLFGIP